MDNSMRITGMASGMDINQMMKDIMRAERVPLDKLTQQRQVLEWQRNDYREMNMLVTKFRDSIFDSVLMRTNMASKTVESSNSDKITATASAAAGNSTYRISEVKQLATAASNFSNKKLSELNSELGGNPIDSSKSLQSQLGNNTVWKKGVIEKQSFTMNSTTTGPFELKVDEGVSVTEPLDAIVKVNGELYEVVDTETALGEGKVYLNSTDGTLSFHDTLTNESKNLNKEFQISVSYITDKKKEEFTPTEETSSFYLKKGSINLASLEIRRNGDTTPLTIVENEDEITDSNVYINLETGQIKFKNKTKDKIEVTYQQNYLTGAITTHNETGETKEKYIFEGNKSLDNVLSEISSSGVGVSGFYDSFSDKVSMTRTETGRFNPAGTEMNFVGDFFTNVLGLNSQRADANKNGVIETGETGEIGGQNAIFTVNGLETERYSNTFSLNNVTFTLKDKITLDENPVMLSVNTNTEKVFETIKGFVDEYNELIDKVQVKLKEERYRDYKPLTSEEKEALSEREVELWEEKAKSGMLRRDTILTNGMNQLRVDVYSPVTVSENAAFRQLSDLGITTTKDFMAGGKLELNEAKLKEAIGKDPEAVYQVFAADGNSFGEKGLARRMRETLGTMRENIINRAGNDTRQNHQFTIGRNLDNIEDRISSFERRLQQVESRYWKQFTAMEKAMQRSNNQANFLFSNLSGGQQQ